MAELQNLMRELMALWAVQGAPIATHLLPGATTEQLDRAQSELGFPLSTEVRDWYAFHNGYTNPASPTQGAHWPNGDHPGSLDEAISDHHALKAQAREATLHAQGFATFDVGPAWITLVRPSKIMLMADCSAAANNPDAASGLHYVNFQSPKTWDQVVLPSVTSLVQGWLTLTRTGAIWYDRDLDDWDSDPERIPTELDLQDIVYL